MTETKRWMPLGWALLLALPILGMSAAAKISIGPALWPLFVLTDYLMLVLLLNRTRLEAEPGGLWLVSGPLPAGWPRRQWFAREQVRQVFVRTEPTGKGGETYYLAASTPEREWVDLLGAYGTKEEAMVVATKLAAYWSLPGGPVMAPANARVLNRRRMLVMLGWVGLYVLAVAWNVLMELRPR